MACSWCRKPGCRRGRPLCRKARSATEKYRVCECGGYQFPHRRASGACQYNATGGVQARWTFYTGLPWTES